MQLQEKNKQNDKPLQIGAIFTRFGVFFSHGMFDKGVFAGMRGE
jgi:hypothetical protein